MLQTETVIDCPDPLVLARFYADLLDAEMGAGSANWARVIVGGDLLVSFQRVENYLPPLWPTQERGQQMHFDIKALGVRATRERALSLGATPLSEILDPGPDEWCILADPAGHPFCLVSNLSAD